MAGGVLRRRLVAVRVLRAAELGQVRVSQMVSVFGWHFVGPKAGVESIDFFLRLDLGFAGGDILAREDRFTGDDVCLAVDANTEKQIERYQCRLRGGRYPDAMAKDHRKAVHRSLPFIAAFGHSPPTSAGVPI